MTPEQQFLDNLPLIERIVAAVCRRYRCREDEAEEFAAEVKVRFVEEGYAVFRKFEGRARLGTFLTTVITNQYRDRRIAQQGKWHASAEARRGGWEAERLEQMIYRQGWTVSEAVDRLLADAETRLSRDELLEIAGRLPPRQPRRFVGEEALDRAAVRDGVESRVHEAERLVAAGRVVEALNELLRGLSDRERLIFRLHFREGWTVQKIACRLKEPARPLYDLFKRIERGLRRGLEAQGVGWELVKSVLGEKGPALPIDWGGAAVATSEPDPSDEGNSDEGNS